MKAKFTREIISYSASLLDHLCSLDWLHFWQPEEAANLNSKCYYEGWGVGGGSKMTSQLTHNFDRSLQWESAVFERRAKKRNRDEFYKKPHNCNASRMVAFCSAKSTSIVHKQSFLRRRRMDVSLTKDGPNMNCPTSLERASSSETRKHLITWTSWKQLQWKWMHYSQA